MAFAFCGYHLPIVTVGFDRRAISHTHHDRYGNARQEKMTIALDVPVIALNAVVPGNNDNEMRSRA